MDGIHSSPTIKDPVASTGVINCLRIMLLGDGYVGAAYDEILNSFLKQSYHL